MNANKKLAKKLAVGSLAVVVAVGTCAAFPVSQNEVSAQTEQEKEAEDLTGIAEDLLNKEQTTEDKSGETSKEETVYVKADASGNTQSVIVTEWLKTTESGSLQDTTELSDIENIKGDETFSESTENAVTWEADGQDIYYQGISEKELPVGVSVSYKLDGKEISADELAGKSGSLEMMFTYTNQAKQTVDLNGTETEMYTPFTMVSAMMLPTDSFSNVTVENGKVISDGEREIVVGIGFPGLEENLNLQEEESITIPSSFTVKADVEDVEIGPTVTLATADILNQFDFDEIGSFDELFDSITDLENATEQLVDGSQDAAEGAVTLADGASELSGGAATLADGSQTLSNGVNTLNSKSGDMIDGITTISNGFSQYAGGVTQLAEGSEALLNGVNTLSAGANSLNSGIQTAASQATQLAGAASSIQQGINQVGSQLGTASSYLSAINEENIKASVSVNGGSATLSDEEIDAIIAANFPELEDETMRTQIHAAIAQAVNQSTIDTSSVTKELTPTGSGLIQTAQQVQTGMVTAQAALTDTANSQLAQGIAGVTSGTQALAGALGMGDGTTQTIGSGAAALAYGISGEGNENSLLNGAAKMNAGASTLAENTEPLLSGFSQLENGSSELVSGVSQLADGADQVATGAGTLADGSKTLAEGAGPLSEGIQTLADGLAQYKEEAIDQLTEVFDGDLRNVTNRIDQMKMLSEEYKSYAGINADMAGKTKFIIETESISK